MPDRAGFNRRYGIRITHAARAPFLSLGIHVDWHTPTFDLHIGRTFIGIGKNVWDRQGRFDFSIYHGTGHTDHCMCKPQQQELIA